MYLIIGVYRFGVKKGDCIDRVVAVRPTKKNLLICETLLKIIPKFLPLGKPDREHSRYLVKIQRTFVKLADRDFAKDGVFCWIPSPSLKGAKPHQFWGAKSYQFSGAAFSARSKYRFARSWSRWASHSSFAN